MCFLEIIGVIKNPTLITQWLLNFFIRFPYYFFN